MNTIAKRESDKKIEGVCSGLAAHYGWDVSLVRLAFVLAAVLGQGLGLIAYVVLAVVMPKAGRVQPPPPSQETYR